MEADFVDPVSGMETTMRSVTTMNDDDHYTFEAFMRPEGGARC